MTKKTTAPKKPTTKKTVTKSKKTSTAKKTTSVNTTTKSTENDVDKQCKKILEKAKELDLENNFFFSTTFDRYREQLNILEKLKVAIEENGPTVTKEYVKGRENLVTNPAIGDYNKTATAANGTVATLLKIMMSVADEQKKPAKDLMNEFLAC